MTFCLLLLPMGFGAILVSQVLNSAYMGPIAAAAVIMVAIMVLQKLSK